MSRDERKEAAQTLREGSSAMGEISNREIINCALTQLIKVRLDAVGSRHRADESGFQKRAPFVDQTAVSAVVVLWGRNDTAVSDTAEPQTEQAAA